MHLILIADRYADEKRNGGWNILSTEYTLAVSCATAKFAELREQWKEKKAPDAGW